MTTERWQAIPSGGADAQGVRIPSAQLENVAHLYPSPEQRLTSAGVAPFTLSHIRIPSVAAGLVEGNCVLPHVEKAHEFVGYTAAHDPCR